MGKVIYSTPIQPRQVRLEISSFCNASCFPCHKNTATRPSGHMEMRLLYKCVGDIGKFPNALLEIVPSNFGETFLHPQWLAILQYIAGNLPKVRMVIPTNGTLLDEAAIEGLAKVRTLKLMNFSVNAALPQTYEAFHKLPARNLELIQRSIELLKKRRPDIAIWISMVQDSQFQSPREVELFREMWSPCGEVQINPVQYCNRPDRAPLVPVNLPCRSIFSDLVVNWTGKITSCCFAANEEEELVVGDATKDELLHIWHSKRFNELRTVHNEGKRADLQTCRGCTFA